MTTGPKFDDRITVGGGMGEPLQVEEVRSVEPVPGFEPTMPAPLPEPVAAHPPAGPPDERDIVAISSGRAWVPAELATPEVALRTHARNERRIRELEAEVETEKGRRARYLDVFRQIAALLATLDTR